MSESSNHAKAQMCRAVWESRRADMRCFLREKKFNPKAIEKVIDNFIETMVYTVEQTGDLAFAIAAKGPTP